MHQKTFGPILSALALVIFAGEAAARIDSSAAAEPPPNAIIPEPAFVEGVPSDVMPGVARPDDARAVGLSGMYLGASIGALVLVPPANWHGERWPRREQFARSWTEAPTWNDGDPWTTNYVGHPLMGSELYLFGRRSGHGQAYSFVLSSAASIAWEYGLEAWFEQPSWPDLLVTSTVGAVLGELRWLGRERLRGSPGFWRRVALAVIDPMGELETLAGVKGAR